MKSEMRAERHHSSGVAQSIHVYPSDVGSILISKNIFNIFGSVAFVVILGVINDVQISFYSGLSSCIGNRSRRKVPRPSRCYFGRGFGFSRFSGGHNLDIDFLKVGKKLDLGILSASKSNFPVKKNVDIKWDTLVKYGVNSLI